MVEENRNAESSDIEYESIRAKFSFSEGKGTPLKELPSVQAVGSRTAAGKQLEAQLETLHRLVFGRPGKTGERRRALENFSGFPSEMRDDVLQRVHRLKKDKLRDLIKALGMPVQISKRQAQVADEIVDFLMEPRNAKKVVRTSPPKRKAVKRRRRTLSHSASAERGSQEETGHDKPSEEKPKHAKKEVPVGERLSSTNPPSDDAIRVAIYKRLFVTPREERARLTTKTLRLELEKIFGDLEGRKAVIKEAASECVFALVAAEEAVSASLVCPQVYTSRNGSYHAMEPSPAPHPPQSVAVSTTGFARSQAPPQLPQDGWAVQN